MKYRDALWLLLLLALPGCHHARPAPEAPSADYIVLSHKPERDNSRFIRPLILCTRPHAVLPECDNGGVHLLSSKPLNAAQRDTLQHLICHIVRTDSLTYRAMVTFVQQNPAYFTTDRQYLPYLTDCITVNGQLQGVLLRSNQLVVLLTAHLQAHRGDKALVEILRRELREPWQM